MKRASYFRQVLPLTPAPQRAGIPLLAPPRLVFRPSGALGPVEIDSAPFSLERASKRPYRAAPAAGVPGSGSAFSPAAAPLPASSRPADRIGASVPPDEPAVAGSRRAEESATAVRAALAALAPPSPTRQTEPTLPNVSPTAAPQRPQSVRPTSSSQTIPEAPTTPTNLHRAAESLTPALVQPPKATQSRPPVPAHAIFATPPPPEPVAVALPAPRRALSGRTSLDEDAAATRILPQPSPSVAFAGASRTAAQRLRGRKDESSAAAPSITPPPVIPPPSLERARAATKLHIGTLEVRVLAPSSARPSAPAPSTPSTVASRAGRHSGRSATSTGSGIARGFAVFGLGQS